MLKNLLWALLGIIIVLPMIAGLGGIKLEQFSSMEESAAKQIIPPEVVNMINVRKEEWQPRVSSVGSVMAVQGTEVSTEAEGVVREIKFEPGKEVLAGDLLVQLDVDVEQAELRAAEASAELSLVSYKRAKQLIESQNISQQEFDAAAVGLKESLAKVENLKAIIAKKTVRAPFAGKLGIKHISVGQFLQKGSPVVSLQALDPVFVDFSLPQQHLGKVKEGLTISVTTDAYPDQRFEGKITAINPGIDPATRSVRVQATLPNSDRKLRPGMFASVDLILGHTETVLLIPSTAVQHAPYGDSVFVIEEPDEKSEDTTASLVVRQQFVRLGDHQGDFVVAREGVKEGDRIVSTGVFKLRPGQAVEIDNTLAPEFKLDPKPANT